MPPTRAIAATRIPDTRNALGRVVPGDRTAYLQAVAALCASRLLLPIVAGGDDGGEGPDPSRHAELAAVLLTSAVGTTGVLAFTGLDALNAWNPSARPVPCTLDDLAATAVETGSSAVVVDVAGPHRLVIEEPLVSQLAAGRRLVSCPTAVGAGSTGPPIRPRAVRQAKIAGDRLPGRVIREVET